MASFPATRDRRPPEIVRIVLSQLARQHSSNELTRHDLLAKLNRLSREELAPRHLLLIVRDLPNGTMRFIVKEEPTGAICDLLDCPCKKCGADREDAE